MTEFEKQNSEFNAIQSEYLHNKEYGPVNEKIDDIEEFVNDTQLRANDDSKTKKLEDQQSDLSSKMSSIQGETAAKSVTASISSSMGTAVSAIALCVATVGVSAYADNANTKVPVIDNSFEESQEQVDYIYDDVLDNHNEELDKLDEQEEMDNTDNEVKNGSLSRFEISADNYGGTYDGNSHSGNIVNVPEGAVITYGESRDSCILREMPEFTDAGEYTVYYEVNREGYETYYGSFVVKIDKKTLDTPAPSTEGAVYNGEVQTPQLVESDHYTYSGVMSAQNAGVYKVKLKLIDPKNYRWADGSSEDKVITWSIKPRELTIEWNGQKDYIYNGQKHVVDVTLGNVIPGDFLNFTVKENIAREPGTYTAEVVSFGGSSNYVLPKQCSYKWRISKN